MRKLLAAVVGLTLVMAGCTGAAIPTATPTQAPMTKPVATAAPVPTATTRQVQPTPTASASILQQTPTPAKAKPTGKLIVAVDSLESESIDPRRYTSTLVGPIVSELFDGLIGYLPQSANPSLGYGGAQLASSWEVSNNGWTFHLRKDARWTNGDPITAEDAKLGYDEAVKPEFKNQYGALMASNTQGMQVIDTSTVLVRTQGPRPNVIYNFVIFGLPLPAKYIRQVGADQWARGVPVSSGPFKLVRQVKGDLVEMTANLDHYSRVPHVRDLQIRVVPETTTRIAMLKAGEADIASGIGGNYIKDVQDDRTLRTVSAKKTAESFMHVFDQNLKGTPLSNVKVRLALSHAIDRAAIGQILYYGEASPSLEGAGFNTGRSGADPSLKGNPYDPALAKRLLAEAGYPNGFDVELSTFVSASVPLLPETAVAIQGMLAKVGINVSVTRYDQGTAYGKYRSKEMVGKGLGFMSYSYSPSGLSGLETGFISGGPYSYVSDAEVDALYAKASNELDIDTQIKLLRQTNRLILDRQLAIQVVYINSVWGIGPKVAKWEPLQSVPISVGMEYVELR